MAQRPRKSRAGRAVLFLLALAAALVALRFLGPGGRPAEEPRPPAPAPDAPKDAPAPPAGAAAAPLRGRVVGAGDAPVAGASVEALVDVPGEPAPRTIRAGPTGSDGKFEIAGVPALRGRLRVRVSKGPLSVEADLSDAPGSLAMDLRLPASFTVAGIVVSAEEGRPLPDIEVRWGEIATRTDTLGRFVFRDVTAAALSEPLPDIELSGAGRRPHRRPLPRDRGLDDLLIRLERE